MSADSKQGSFAANTGQASAARQPWAWRLGIAAAVLWWIALALMALFTANEVVLSRDQIAAADIVITGKPVAGKNQTVAVERVWSGELAEKEIAVANLPDSPLVKTGESIILPLSRAGDQYRITTLQPVAPPLIYPATPEALDQLRQMAKR